MLDFLWGNHLESLEKVKTIKTIIVVVEGTISQNKKH